METFDYTASEITTVGCGCAACQSSHSNPSNQTSSTNVGVADAPTNVADPNEFANYLQNGYWEDRGYSAFSWTQNTVEYSITGYDANQKAGFQAALDLWSDVADIDFVEVSSGADLSIVKNSEGRAYSSTPYNVNGEIISSTISIDTNVNSFSNIGTIGNYAFMTALHEIGHSLGLGHTANYNGSASYSTHAQWTNDTHQTTVMSYFNDSNVGSDHIGSTGGWQYSATPMLIDILAIQNIYGADYGTRSGNTTYGFNSNAGKDQYDFSIVEAPIAIWDGGGTDTIDLSGYSTDQTLYLTEGDYSSVGHMTNNLVIAYGAEIENAVGGTGNDTFYANDLDNNIDGGAGTDTVNYFYNVTDFAFNFINNAVVTLTHLTENFTDTLSSIENFIFSDSTYNFTELENNFGGSDVVALRTSWTGGEHAYNIEGDENTTITAASMGYSGSSGTQFSISRTDNDTTITIEDQNAPDTIKLYGSDRNDSLQLNGTHTSLTAKLYGGNGDDELYITVSGNHSLYGDAGNDLVNGYNGHDKLYGGIGNDDLSGGSGNDLLYGQDGDDTLNGGHDNDKLYGGIGHDILNGEAGNDRLIGGEGDDELYGGEGDDRLDADVGDDTLNGGAGKDKLYGYDGVDTLYGGDDNDRLYGMNDDDTLNGGNGNDLLLGGAGNDDLFGGEGHDRSKGEAGNDTLYGDGGKDKLYGEAGDDFLYGGDLQDRLYGGTGADNLNGDSGNDLLYGQDGDDTLYGGIGHDRLEGGNDHDILYGEDGIDRLYGDGGNDTLRAGNDDDILYGGTGNDILHGDAGNDILYGNDGNDLLVGGAGLNTLTGGAGNDTFGFTALDNQTDKIEDFTLTGAEQDSLNITNILSGYNAGVDDINDFVALSVQHAGRTDLFISENGTGANWEKVATIRGSDFTGTSVDDLLNSNQLITDTNII